MKLTAAALRYIAKADGKAAGKLPSRYPRACIVYCPRNSGVAWMVRQGRVNVAEYKGPEAKRLASDHRDQILAKLKN